MRERIKDINSVDELSKYWKELNLSDKQKDVLKNVFRMKKIALSKVEEKDGVE